MPCFLNVNLGAEYSKRFVFVRVFVKKLHCQSTISMLQFVAFANTLLTSSTPLDMIVSTATNRMLVILRTSEIINYL